MIMEDSAIINEIRIDNTPKYMKSYKYEGVYQMQIHEYRTVFAGCHPNACEFFFANSIPFVKSPNE